MSRDSFRQMFQVLLRFLFCTDDQLLGLHPLEAEQERNEALQAALDKAQERNALIATEGLKAAGKLSALDSTTKALENAGSGKGK